MWEEEKVRWLGPVVIGDTIEFDEADRQLAFLITQVPADYVEVEKRGGLAAVLENAVNDPNRLRLKISITL